MLRVSDCPLSRYSNDEHYKYQTEVKDLIARYPAVSSLITREQNNFLKLYLDEGEALGYVRGSVYTEHLGVADAKCNETLDGLEAAIISGLKHYNPVVKGASQRLKIWWDTNGNIKEKSQKSKSGAIIKLVTDFKGPYSADVNAAGLNGWVAELEADLNTHDEVEKTKYTEKAGKTDLRMRQVRIEIDKSYRTIITKMNALIVVNGEEPFTEFVNELNARIASYSNNLAIRNGKPKKGTDSAETK